MINREVFNEFYEKNIVDFEKEYEQITIEYENMKKDLKNFLIWSGIIIMFTLLIAFFSFSFVLFVVWSLITICMVFLFIKRENDVQNIEQRKNESRNKILKPLFEKFFEDYYKDAKISSSTKVVEDSKIWNSSAQIVLGEVYRRNERDFIIMNMGRKISYSEGMWIEFDGLFASYEISENIQDIIYIKNGKKRKKKNKTFNTIFNVRSENKNTVNKVITKDFKEKLLMLYEFIYERDIIISIYKNKIYIAMNGVKLFQGKEFFNGNINSSVVYEYLINLENLLKQIKELI